MKLRICGRYALVSLENFSLDTTNPYWCNRQTPSNLWDWTSGLHVNQKY